MATSERARLEEVLDLARQLATHLEPLTCTADEPEALALRLAQAHALGLIDQLAELVSASQLPSAPMLSQRVVLAIGDESVHPHH